MAPHRTSMLVPFRDDDGTRTDIWEWLERKWHTVWPDLEIIMGHDDGELPFSKAMAVNDAARRADGDVFIIADADVYMAARSLRHTCERVYKRELQWALPWEHMIHLAPEDTEAILAQDPAHILHVTDEMRTRLVAITRPPGSLQVVPREAFELVRGYDERFRGWGGDDSSFFWAVDTLWGQHTRTDNELVHMGHARLRSVETKRWVWAGQEDWTHKDLEMRYRGAWHDARRMRAIVAGHDSWAAGGGTSPTR